LLKACGSVYVAIALMLVLIPVLVWGTRLWNQYDEAAAKFAVYEAWWFTVLGFLLGANILAALLARFPWRWRQAGFAVAHVGLLALLAGCWMSRQSGVEAMLSVFEHRASGQASQDSVHFELLVLPDQGAGAPAASRGGTSEGADLPKPISIPFRPGPFDWQHYDELPWFPWKLVGHDQGLTYVRDGIRLEVLDYYANYKLMPIPRLELRLEGEVSSPHGGVAAEALRTPLVFSVQEEAGPHGSMGTRKGLPAGQQIDFWMTGSREETAAFLGAKPQGPLGKLGRVSLSVRGEHFQWPVDDWKPGQRKPLGKTGLEVELVKEDSRYYAVVLAIHAKVPSAPKDKGHEAGGPQPMALYADLPLSNRQDYQDGVFGTYWRDTSPQSQGDAAPHSGLSDPGRPRIDILQGADQKLYVRTWRAGKLAAPVPLPTDGVWTAFSGTPDAVSLAVARFLPAAKPDTLPEPLNMEEAAAAVEAEKGGRQLFPRQIARVRVSIDGADKEFWLSPDREEPPAKVRLGVEGAGNESWSGPDREESQEKPAAAAKNLRNVTRGQGRRVAVALRQDVLDLGVTVGLRQFQRILYPGTAEAEEYSSLVDILDRSTNKPVAYGGEVLAKRKIAMNVPLDFAQPDTGGTYRLFQSSYQSPQSSDEFEPHRTGGEDLAYMSNLTVGSDPGRYLKYAGCILVVAGVFLRYFVRFRTAALLVCAMAATAGATRAQDANDAASGHPPAGHPSAAPHGHPGGMSPHGFASHPDFAAPLGLAEPAEAPAVPPVAFAAPPLDWSAWRRLPVFDNGRVMPLDSFARSLVKHVCGTAEPRLAMPGGPHGIGATSRRFDAAELLFAWLAEPEAWEHVAFLPADDEFLRGELLQVPAQDEGGRWLRYVSPLQVSAASGFQERLARLAQRQQMGGGRSPRLAALEKQIKGLSEAFLQYRQVTFDPARPMGGRDRFLEMLGAAFQSWNELEQHLLRLPLGDAPGDFGKRVRQTSETVQKLTALFSDRGGGEPPPLAKIEPLLASLAETTEQLAAGLADLRQKGRQAAKPTEGGGDVWRARALLGMIANQMASVAQMVVEARAALYDQGLALRLLPAMDAGALEADRFRDNNQPWLSAQTLFQAPEGMLNRYPRAALGEARQAYRDAMDAYRRPDDPERSAQFSAAIDRLAAALRDMGEAIEPQRRQLPIREKETELLDATAYPPPGSTRTEVLYNHLDPFYWSLVLSVAAAVCLALAVGPLRKPMFWGGIGLTAAVEGLIVAGLCLRWCITGWIPLASMFETIVFAGLCVTAIGLVLTLLPPREVYARRPVAIVGALAALLALGAANYVPTFHQEIEPLKAVLRSNYWLSIHITTIMASYGAAFMACGLGIYSLFYYLFGSYRPRPPEVCTVLAPMIYKLLQLTVLLLAVGTILGAMWADVSWGRFWGWDPKEVWALVSLLVYMVVLHSRHVGWASHFNLAVGAVLGFVAILWTWYGVNFIMSAGKHAYAQGAGGQEAIFALFGVILLLLAAASGRYVVETSRRSP